MRQAILDRLRTEPVFFISMVMAILASFISRPNLQTIDWKVIVVLFNLMAVIVALEKYQVLDRISLVLIQKFTSIRYLSICLVFLTGVFAMFITNDVALLTMVPLTILIAKRCKFNPVWIVIYQTLAANIGSSLTPMGNPQNLFLYEFFHIRNGEFILTVLPLVAAGFIIIWLLLLKIPSKTVHYKLETMSDQESTRRQLLYLLIFGLVVLSVLRFLDYRLMFAATLLVIFHLDRDIFGKIDYFLLGTFVAFFLFVGSISQLPGLTTTIAGLLSGEGHTFLWGVLTSQIISNVPAALLLANFSGNYRELLWGVNVGGLGTLIASLASLISYKIYAREYPANKYMLKFHVVNFAGLLLLSLVFYLLQKVF